MRFSTRLESVLAAANRRVNLHARRFRLHYIVLAFAVFCSGMVASIHALDLDWGALELHWLLVNLLLGAPIAIGLNALGLMVSAGIVGASLTFPAAFRTCCIALCSNLLPIPAGTVIQASSLASRGGTVLQSGLVILLGNGISLALVIALVGAILVTVHPAIGFPLLTFGLLGLTVLTHQVYKRTTFRVVLAFLAVRSLRVIAVTLRIQLSFLAIGLIVALLDAALFTGAIALGTVVTVFPAGLGVSESLAALLAIATSVAPGAAFLATALNRLITLAFAGVYLLMTKPSHLEATTR